MSYSLVFAHPPIPSDDDEAFRWVRKQLDAYRSDFRPPHSQLKLLYDALTDQYPCLCDLPDEQMDEAVWCSGPLIDRFSHKLAVVSVAFTRLEEVMPFIVATALRIGCAVFDLQGMMIYRPGGMFDVSQDVAV
jgi:hypothetical protein